MQRTIDEVAAMGITPIYLGDNPRPPAAVLQCLVNNLKDVSNCYSLRSETTRSDIRIAGRQLVTEFGGYYLDLADFFCAEAICPAVVGNTLLYRDWSHITEEAARLLAPVVTGLMIQYIESTSK
jgi:hypothetical protein